MRSLGVCREAIVEPALRPSTSDTKEDRVGDHVGGIESGLRLRLVAITSSSASFMGTSGGGGEESPEDSFFIGFISDGNRDGGLGAERCLARRSHENGGFGLGRRERAPNRKETQRNEGIC